MRSFILLPLSLAAQRHGSSAMTQIRRLGACRVPDVTDTAAGGYAGLAAGAYAGWMKEGSSFWACRSRIAAALRVFPDMGTPDRTASSGIEQWLPGEPGAMPCQVGRNLA